MVGKQTYKYTDMQFSDKLSIIVKETEDIMLGSYDQQVKDKGPNFSVAKGGLTDFSRNCVIRRSR